MKEIVVVVHGHLSPDFVSLPLLKHLEREGYATRYWPYPSLSTSVTVHANNLKATIAELEIDPGVERIHFVGHSLGTIIIQYTLNSMRPNKLGRIVLLAPPNKGVWLATLLSKISLGKIVLAQELSQTADSLVNQLQPLRDVEIGTVAARFDHFVARATAHVAGERDHLMLTSLHTLPLHHATPKYVVNFLRHGEF